MRTERNTFKESDVKFRIIRDHLIMKIHQSNSSKSDLETLLKLEPLKLIAMYDKVLQSVKNSSRIKIIEDTIEIPSIKTEVKIEKEDETDNEAYSNSLLKSSLTELNPHNSMHY